MEDKNLILQVMWDVVKSNSEVKNIGKGFCLGFFSCFFFPLGSYLDCSNYNLERRWFVQISAPLQGGDWRGTRSCKTTGVTAELAPLLHDPLSLQIA